MSSGLWSQVVFACVALPYLVALAVTGVPYRESWVAICLAWLQCEIQVPYKPGLGYYYEIYKLATAAGNIMQLYVHSWSDLAIYWLLAIVQSAIRLVTLKFITVCNYFRKVLLNWSDRTVVDYVLKTKYVLDIDLCLKSRLYRYCSGWKHEYWVVIALATSL